uniref:Serpin B6 n=1 Tax=Poecilia reticulata TaxID=8081 RepID=A0A3P9NTV5_POERE
MASSSSLSKPNTTFSLALLRKLSEDNNTANIFFSPFSISSALAMVMLGARGDTATQISEVILYFDIWSMSSCTYVKIQYTKVYFIFTRELNNPEAKFVLSVANRLFGEKSYSFLQEFLTKAKTHYNSELEAVDFRTKCEEARVKINNWVEEQTQGKIKNMVVKGMVNNMTKMVLVNAIYFKGKWSAPFQRSNTREVQFRLNKKDTKPVQMMELKSHFHHASIDEASCETDETSPLTHIMIALSPDQLEDLLTAETFMEWTHPHEMERGEIVVKLPRFKLEEKYDLNKVLSSMGMVDAFDETKCDFSGMSSNKGLFLSQVSHKAFVEVNEEGTEAAAATGNLVADSVSFFTADHPFLFFIRNRITKTILFAGRFCSP